MLNSPCIPWIKSHLIMVYYFYVLLDSVCLSFLDNFYLNAQKGYLSPGVPRSLSTFNIRVILTSDAL